MSYYLVCIPGKFHRFLLFHYFFSSLCEHCVPIWKMLQMYVNDTTWNYMLLKNFHSIWNDENKYAKKYCRGIMTVCGVVLLHQPFQMKYLKFIHDAHSSFCYYEYNSVNWCPIVIMRNRKLNCSNPNHCFPRTITVIQCE